MAYTVEVTANFDAEFSKLSKRYASLFDDVAGLISELTMQPLQGNALGKGCYKVRMAIRSKGKGKSGGARVITVVKQTKERLYLLSIYDKSEQETIMDQRLDFLLRQADLL